MANGQDGGSLGNGSGSAQSDFCGDMTLRDVESVVREALDTMEGDISTADLKILREIESISDYIRVAKHEIAVLRPDEIKSQHIPAATDELDAIVLATEKATNGIMEAAETIEKVAGELDEAQGQRLVEAVTAIYEACGFQDITGQRIGKIVGALQHIEQKIGGLVAAFGDQIGELKSTEPEAPPPASEDDSHLLNGPQLDGEGQSQAEIDALLASFD